MKQDKKLLELIEDERIKEKNLASHFMVFIYLVTAIGISIMFLVSIESLKDKPPQDCPDCVKEWVCIQKSAVIIPKNGWITFPDNVTGKELCELNNCVFNCRKYEQRWVRKDE